MSASQSLAPRPLASLETIHNSLGSLAALFAGRSVDRGAADSFQKRQVSSDGRLGDKWLVALGQRGTGGQLRARGSISTGSYASRNIRSAFPLPG